MCKPQLLELEHTSLMMISYPALPGCPGLVNWSLLPQVSVSVGIHCENLNKLEATGVAKYNQVWHSLA